MSYSLSSRLRQVTRARAWCLILVHICTSTMACADWVMSTASRGGDTTNTAASPVMAASTVNASITASPIVDLTPVEITPEITELARGLRNDPVEIYNFVRNKIAYQAYSGSWKGATGTYLDRAGNDVDQASLLIALLRASKIAGSNVESANYIDFTLSLPATSGDKNNMCQWLGLTDYKQVWSTLQNAGVPYSSDYVQGQPDPGDKEVFTLKLTGVSLRIVGQTAASRLLPSVKCSSPVNYDGAQHLRNQSGFNREYLASLVSGSGLSGVLSPSAKDEVTSVDFVKTEAELDKMAGQLLASFKTATEFNKSMGDLLGGSELSAVRLQSLTECDFTHNEPGGVKLAVTPNERASLAAPERACYTVAIDGNNTTQGASFARTIFTDSLSGRSLGLAFTPEGNAQLLLDGAELVGYQTVHSDVNANLSLALSYPKPISSAQAFNLPSISNARKGLYDITPVVFPSTLNSVRYDHCVRQISNGILQNKSSTWQTLKTLQTLSIKWANYCQTIHQLNARFSGLNAQVFHTFGRAGQNTGYFIDIGGVNACTSYPAIANTDGSRTDESLKGTRLPFFKWLFTSSAMEHHVVREQAGIQAVSATECIYQNLLKGIPIRNITHNNDEVSVDGLSDKLKKLVADEVKFETINGQEIEKSLLLPTASELQIGAWRGQGYFSYTLGNKSSLSGGALLIGNGGDLTNGAAATVIANVNPKDTVQAAQNAAPQNTQPGGTPSAEPVDLATGSYLSDAADMVIGDGSLPTGISFSRHYDSSLNSTFDGIGNGWTHSFSSKIARSTDVYRACGVMQPTDAVRTLAALIVADAFLSSSKNPTAKEQVLALVAVRWGVEKINNNVLSVCAGKDRFAFVSAPTHITKGMINRNVVDLSTNWNPGPGIQAELTENNGILSVYPRSGGVITFDNQSRLSSVSDADGRKATYTYTDSTIKVTDHYNRYIEAVISPLSNGTRRVTSVSDANGRSTSFEYVDGTLGGYVLQKVTDPENYVFTYEYDAFDRLTIPKDHKENALTINSYDTQGRVESQLSQGNAEHKWLFLYSPGQTIEVSPKADSTYYLFDRYMRRVGVIPPVVVATNPAKIMSNAQIFTYDTQGRVLTHQDEDGYKNTNKYDPNGNITESTDAEDNKTSYTYYSSFPYQLHEVKTPGNVTTTYTYYGTENNGRLKSVQIPGKGTSTFAYTADGDIESVLSAGASEGDSKVKYSEFEYGKPKRTEYTSKSGLLTETGAYFTTCTFHPTGDLKSSTDRRGNTTTYSYDKRRLLYITTDALQKTTKTEYDCNGYLWKVTDSNNNTTETNYDNLGHLLNKKVPDTGLVEYKLDAADRVEKIIDGLKHETTYEYTNGQRTKVKNALGHVVLTTTYTNAGRVWLTTDALNQTTEFTYDKVGRLLHSKDPLLKASDTLYSKHGPRSSFTDRRGKTYTWNFDPTTGLETEFVYPSSSSTIARKVEITARHASGLPMTIKTSSGSITNPTSKETTFEYTCTQALLKKTDQVGSIDYKPATKTSPETVKETRMENGVSVERTITRQLTTRNELESCTDASGNIVSYGYDDAGNIRTITYPQGFTVTYTYDGANRLRTIEDSDHRKTVYEYDLAGRISRVYRDNKTVCVFTLDNANQLQATSEQVFDLINPALPPSTDNTMLRPGSSLWVAAYTRYADGKIHTYKPFPGMVPNIPASASMTYNADGQLETYNGAAIESSLDGNLNRAPVNGVMTNLTWDARNRLTQYGSTSLTYDAENRRRTKTEGGITSTYIYNRGKLDQLLMVKRSDGTSTRYIHGRGLVYEINYNANNSQTSVHYYHYDWRGSTMALTNQAATVVARWGYTAYGDGKQVYGDITTPFLFNGQWGVMTDAPGLICMQARFYSIAYHRFLSEDPTGFAGGSNWYAFANGDPINMMDPFGLAAVSSGTDEIENKGPIEHSSDVLKGIFSKQIEEKIGPQAKALLDLMRSDPEAFAKLVENNNGVIASGTVKASGKYGVTIEQRYARFFSLYRIFTGVTADINIQYTISAGFEGGSPFVRVDAVFDGNRSIVNEVYVGRLGPLWTTKKEEKYNANMEPILWK